MLFEREEEGDGGDAGAVVAVTIERQRKYPPRTSRGSRTIHPMVEGKVFM